MKKRRNHKRIPLLKKTLGSYALILFIAFFCPMFALTARAEQSSWIVEDINTIITPWSNKVSTSDETDKKLDDSSKFTDATTKALYKTFINIGNGLVPEDGASFKFGLNGIVLGNLSSNNSVSYAKFGLEPGNPYGIMGAKIYNIMRKVSLGLIYIYVLYLIVSNIIYSSAKSRTQLKEVLGNAFIMIVLMYGMPVVVNFVIGIRDSIIIDIFTDIFNEPNISFLDVENANVLYKASAMNQNGAIASTSKFSLLNAIVWLAMKCAPLIYVFPYVAIAISETIMFIIFPVIALLSVKSKKLLTVWSGNFFAYLLVPLFDSIILMSPKIIELSLRGAGVLGSDLDLEPSERVALSLVQLACLFAAQPARNGIIRLLDGSIGVGTGPSPIASMARGAFMAARMSSLAGGGRGGNSVDGGATNRTKADELMGAQKSEQFADSLKAQKSDLANLEQLEGIKSDAGAISVGFSSVDTDDGETMGKSLDTETRERSDTRADMDNDTSQSDDVGLVNKLSENASIEDTEAEVTPGESNGELDEDVSATTIDKGPGDVEMESVNSELSDTVDSDGEHSNSESHEDQIKASGELTADDKGEIGDSDEVEQSGSANPLMEEFEQTRLENLEKLDEAKAELNDSKKAVVDARADVADWSRIDQANGRLTDLKTELNGYDKSKVDIAESIRKDSNSYEQNEDGTIKYDESHRKTFTQDAMARLNALDSTGRISQIMGEENALERDKATAHSAIAKRAGADDSAIGEAMMGKREWRELGGASGPTNAQDRLEAAQTRLAHNEEIIAKRQEAERNFAFMHKQLAGGSGATYENSRQYEAVTADNERRRSYINFKNFDAKANAGILDEAQIQQYYEQRQRHEMARKAAVSVAKTAGAIAGGAALAYGGADAAMAGAQLGGLYAGGKVNNSIEKAEQMYLDQKAKETSNTSSEQSTDGDDMTRAGGRKFRGKKNSTNDSGGIDPRMKEHVRNAEKNYNPPKS